MFEESLVESSTLLRTRNRWPVVASVSAQIAVLALIIAVPLVHPEILPFHAEKLQSLAPPPMPKPIPPPERVRIEAATASTAPSAPTPALQRIQQIIRTSGTPVEQPILTGPTSMIASIDPSAPFGMNLPGPAGPSVTVAPTNSAKASTKPTRVSLGVTEGLLLNPIRPVYPQIAKITGTQGTVVVHAIISKTGVIESAQVISGPPLLRDAALEAVRNARYHPYLLNNEPTEVDTTISINFRLGS